ncbi:hypothetical protein PIB30_063440 [Stylosanthes scabra]|uniref:Uncharacterized protein n=1 Tax=Stylosanthes scabra TaxID=79078 RepID=A0ABU6XMW0_9FABA|nr:hypothetical protein [Stylosanthes scabra]
MITYHTKNNNNFTSDLLTGFNKPAFIKLLLINIFIKQLFSFDNNTFNFKKGRRGWEKKRHKYRNIIVNAMLDTNTPSKVIMTNMHACMKKDDHETTLLWFYFWTSHSHTYHKTTYF